MSFELEMKAVILALLHHVINGLTFGDVGTGSPSLEVFNREGYFVFPKWSSC